MGKNLFKQIFGMVVATAVTTLTACKVVDIYNKYAYNDVAKANLKRNIKKINPFKKKKLYLIKNES